MEPPASKPPKIFKPVIKCCVRNCLLNFDTFTQKRIFDRFTSLKKYAQRLKFLRAIIRSPDAGKVKYQYYMNDDSGTEHRVCTNMVIGILQVSRVSLHRAGSNRSLQANPTGQELRGQRYTIQDSPFVKQFVETVQVYEATRDSPRSKYKYLHPRVNYKELYAVYKAQYQSKDFKVSDPKQFYRLAHTNALKYVKMQRQRQHYRCQVCTNKPDDDTAAYGLPLDTDEPKTEHELEIEHLQSRFSRCVDTAKKRHTAVLSFELQGALEMPFISATESFNWPQVWFSNFCVSDEVYDKVRMYAWDESIAQRRSDEVASCLIRHIFETVRPNTRKIVLYSEPVDVYRNMTVSLMLKKVFDYWPNKTLRTIEQRFFHKGHNLGKCKKAIMAVNAGRSARSFFGPSDWTEKIRTAMRRYADFELLMMQSTQFYSAKSLLELIEGHALFVDEKEIAWQSINCLKYRRSDPFGLSFKIDGEKFTHILSERSSNDFHAAKLNFSTLKGNPISYTKYHRMMDILPYIPADYRQFYRNLRYKVSMPDKDYALIMDDNVSSCSENDESDEDSE